MTTMKQCRLRRRDADGVVSEQVAWIGASGARVGACVELKTDEGRFWEVTEVYEPAMSASALTEKQRMDRNAFSSIQVK